MKFKDTALYALSVIVFDLCTESNPYTIVLRIPMILLVIAVGLIGAIILDFLASLVEAFE